MKISLLEAFPLKYLPTEEEARTQLIENGRQIVSIDAAYFRKVKLTLAAGDIAMTVEQAALQLDYGFRMLKVLLLDGLVIGNQGLILLGIFL